MGGMRHIRSRGTTQGVLLAVLLGAIPSALGGQQSAPTNPVADEATAAHRKAYDLLAEASMDDWPQVATLLEQAAAARPAGDGTALYERTAAAQLFYMTGALARAETNLLTAARAAISADQIFQGAQLLVQAAFVAEKRGEMGEAIDYAHGAEWLARSPRLTPEQSDRIRSSIHWLPAGAAEPGRSTQT